MSKWVIRTLGLKGSWRWACKKMEQGFWVTQSSATGAVKYKLDKEDQRRIEWTFETKPSSSSSWKPACIFLNDFEATDWIVVEPPKENE